MNDRDPASRVEKWTGLVVWFSLLVLVSSVGVILSRYSMSFASGSDESGYIHNSRLLMEGRLFGDVRPIGDMPLHDLNRRAYQPLGFAASDELDRQIPTYPFGFPLVLAAFRLLADNDLGILMAVVFIGCATLLAVFVLSREFDLDWLWSFVATLVVGVSPLYQFMAMRPMSDVLSTGLATGCVLFAWIAHKRLVFSCLLGFCFSLALLTRAPNVLLALPVGIALLARFREQQWWWAVILSSLPGLLFLLWINNTLYGSPFTSGYANVWRLFKLEYFEMTMRHFAYWLSVLLTPVITIGFAASLYCFRKNWLKMVVLWTWALSFIIFYGFYLHSHQTWWFLRFVLPAVPPIVVGGCVFLQELSSSFNRRFGLNWLSTSLILVFAVYVAISGYRAGLGRVHYLDRQNNGYVRLVDWVNEHTGPEDVFVCSQTSGCLYYYTNNPIIRYDLLKDGEWERIQQAVSGTNGVIYATLLRKELERKEALSKHASGEWLEAAVLGDMRVMRLEK
jgi:hypothetical protein